MDHHHDRNHENNHDYDDDDVIAYIYPAVGTRGYLEAARSIDESAASPLYLSPRRRRHRVVEMPQSGPADIFARHKRERTVEEEEDDDEGQSHGDLDYEACIRVTFDSIPKTRYGLRVGRDSDAEFRVLDLPGVSAYHFALTFDANYRPIVRDLGSKYGTSVIYDDMERGRWRSFDWIVGGSDFLQKVNTIVVKVTKFLQFQLAIPRHDVDSKSYRDRVERFRAGVTDAEQVLDLGRLGPLSRVNTAAPSGARTPTSGPSRHVTAHKKLGTGGFGVVYHVWNVSTGEEYALKEPKKGSGHDAQWKREIVIMKRISHKHIVSLINSCLPPSPWLHLEYMPEGSISDHLHAGKSFDERECKQILAQSSDALAYLHSQDPRIVHRDVKPGNILILRRRPDDLFIKFADFGISREGDTLKTFCGTYAYLAPGVYKGKNITRRRRPTYTALVDVWSLGVVLARLLCGLPKQEEIDNTGVEWCESIRERVERALRQGHRQGQRQDLLSFVLESMLCLDPNDRETAAECHKEALRLLFNSNSVPESDNDRGEAAPPVLRGAAGFLLVTRVRDLHQPKRQGCNMVGFDIDYQELGNKEGNRCVAPANACRDLSARCTDRVVTWRRALPVPQSGGRPARPCRSMTTRPSIVWVPTSLIRAAGRGGGDRGGGVMGSCCSGDWSSEPKLLRGGDGIGGCCSGGCFFGPKLPCGGIGGRGQIGKCGRSGFSKGSLLPSTRLPSVSMPW
ncbi:hypothetical protein RB597_010294 [Gaeumannomyces tritici]